jgi:hypothetical protein
VAAKRLLFQVIGHIGLVMTIPRMLHWAWRLKREPIQPWAGLTPARIPMIDAATGEEISWAIKRPPAFYSPQPVETANTATVKPALSRLAPVADVAC